MAKKPADTIKIALAADEVQALADFIAAALEKEGDYRARPDLLAVLFQLHKQGFDARRESGA